MADNELPPIKAFPTLPDPKEYMHLSEEQKMMQGFPHRPLDKDLSEARVRCRGLVQAYNQTKFDDEQGRRAILDELLHSSQQRTTKLI